MGKRGWLPESGLPCPLPLVRPSRSRRHLPPARPPDRTKPGRALPGAAWSARQETLYRTHRAVMRLESRSKDRPEPPGQPHPARLANGRTSRAGPVPVPHGRTEVVVLRVTSARTAACRHCFRMRNCFCHRLPTQSASWQDSLPRRPPRPPRPLRPKRPEPRSTQPGHPLRRRLRSPARGLLRRRFRSPSRGHLISRLRNPSRQQLGLCRKALARSRAARARASTVNR